MNQTFLSTNLAAVSGVAKGSPAYLIAILAVNRNAATRWCQVFNNTVAPSPGDVPVVEFQVNATDVAMLGAAFFSQYGTTFTKGITFGMSTTSGTYTAATAADHDVFVTYRNTEGG